MRFVRTLARQVAVTYSGHIVGSGLGFLVQLLLQRQLAPADYGVLAIAVAVGSFAGVLTDSGISFAMVRLGGVAIARAPESTNGIVRCAAALRLRLGLTVVVSAIGFLSADAILTIFYPH